MRWLRPISLQGMFAFRSTSALPTLRGSGHRRSDLDCRIVRTHDQDRDSPRTKGTSSDMAPIMDGSSPGCSTTDHYRGRCNPPLVSREGVIYTARGTRTKSDSSRGGIFTTADRHSTNPYRHLPTREGGKLEARTDHGARLYCGLDRGNSCPVPARRRDFAARVCLGGTVEWLSPHFIVPRFARH